MAGEGPSSSYTQASLVLIWLLAYHTTTGWHTYPIVHDQPDGSKLAWENFFGRSDSDGAGVSPIRSIDNTPS